MESSTVLLKYPINVPLQADGGEKLIESELDSIETVYQKYHRSVFRACMGLLKNREDAEDATHEVFFTVNKHLSSFRGESKLFSWIYSIAINISLQIIRKKRGNDVTHLLPDFEAAKDLRLEERFDAKRTLNWLFQKSNKRSKMVILLRFMNRLTQEEVAEVLSLNVRTVRSIEKKISNRLKAYFSTL